MFDAVGKFFFVLILVIGVWFLLDWAARTYMPDWYWSINFWKFQAQFFFSFLAAKELFRAIDDDE